SIEDTRAELLERLGGLDLLADLDPERRGPRDLPQPRAGPAGGGPDRRTRQVGPGEDRARRARLRLAAPEPGLPRAPAPPREHAAMGLPTSSGIWISCATSRCWIMTSAAGTPKSERRRAE